jgi:AcrR family transcriptional regulator
MNYASPIRRFVEDTVGQKPERLNQSQRQTRAIAATLEACASNGPLSLRVGDIADAAGVSTATIYMDFEHSEDLLKRAILLGLEIVSHDWQSRLKQKTRGGKANASLEAFMGWYASIYNDPYIDWMLRADLAMMVCGDDLDVRTAVIKFQDDLLNWAIASLPSHKFGFEDSADIGQILIGALQVTLVNDKLAPRHDAGLGQNDRDLEALCRDILTWLHPISAGELGVRIPKSVFLQRPNAQRQKSDIETEVEAILAKPAKRSNTKLRYEKILAATMQICAAFGFEHAKLSDIAPLAGVSTATIYSEFGDRETLIKGAIAHFLPIYAKATMVAVSEPEPVKRLERLLKAQALTLTDPFGAWIYRHYIKLEAEQNDVERASAAAAREASSSFWDSQFTALIAQGHLKALDLDLTRNMIFGGIHRRSVLARLLQDDDALVSQEIEASVAAACSMLFEIYGTKAAVGGRERTLERFPS